MNDAEQFFYEHAGYSYKPDEETPEQGRERVAVALAAAERWAHALGCELVIEPEEDFVTATDEQRERIESGETIYVWAQLKSAAGVSLASLGGIEVEDESDPYLRVVAAELADEARAELNETLRKAFTAAHS